MARSNARTTAFLLFCLLVPAVQAGPALRLEAGLAQFDLEHEGREDRATGSTVILTQEDRYDSGAALRLGLEAAWPRGERLEWLLGVALTHAGSADKSVWQRTTTGTVERDFALDSLQLLNARGGLRWQQAPGPVRWHADLAVSASQWRYDYARAAPGQDATDGDFATVDATLGFIFALGPRLDFVVDYGEQHSRSNHNRQALAGLRYTLGSRAP